MVKARNKKTIPIFLRWLPLTCFAILSSRPCYGQESPTPALQGRFPYMCSIRRPGLETPICSGTLVASNWVLTAAHCLDPADTRSAGKSPLIYCGIYGRNERDTTKTYGTTRCHLHHLWTGSVLDGNDIALCELDRASNSPTPNLVTAADAPKRFDQFTVLGWGVSADTSQYAEQLQIGSDSKFVPDSMCNDTEGWRGRFKESMICVGFGDPKTCGGDAGGPLLVPDEKNGSVELGDPSRDLIVGITSFGDPSCNESIPGFYTKVSCYRTWITCIIAEEAEDCRVHLPCEEPLLGCPGAARSARFNEAVAIQTFKTAIETDDAETVKTVICEGLNPNTTISFLNETLLELAARNDAVESTKILLRYGAAIDGDDLGPYNIFGPRENVGTPLNTATDYGSVRIMEVLIKNGANIDAKEVDTGYTPLMRSVVEKNISIVRLLLRNGADLQLVDSNGFYALHLAAKVNVPEIAKVLIDAGAEMEFQTVSQRSGNPFAPVILQTLYRTFDFVTRVSNVDAGGWTPLHAAARYNSSDVTKVLLDSGARIDRQTFTRFTPLHIAAMSNAYDVAKILIDSGANVKSEELVYWTPLHFAAQNNSLAIAKALVAAGVNEEAQTSYGYDPLMIASYHGSLSVVQFLLNISVTLSSVNNVGNTALHLAAARGQITVVEALLENGASKQTTNNQGETPFDEICSRLAESECSSQTNSTLQELLKLD